MCPEMHVCLLVLKFSVCTFLDISVNFVSMLWDSFTTFHHAMTGVSLRF